MDLNDLESLNPQERIEELEFQVQVEQCKTSKLRGQWNKMKGEYEDKIAQLHS